MGSLLTREITRHEMLRIAEEFSAIAHDNSIRIKTCAEGIDLDQFGIEHAACLDRHKIESIINCSLSSKIKQDNQRDFCGCIQNIDIGAYDTCRHGCKYCYANMSTEQSIKNCQLHDPKSALLIGDSTKVEKITNRKVESFRDHQLSF